MKMTHSVNIKRVWKNVRRAILASCIACTAIQLSGATLRAEEKLTIGSTAPALDIQHWISNGEGKFKPVTRFENGKIYVVEFWATWCGPCVSSMPHLVKIQKEFADKGVQIVSVSDEDTDTIKEFLDQKFEADDEAAEGGSKKEKLTAKTYRELTNAYCLTADPDASTHEAYMKAANQNGIPCAFIVGKDQKIEWIGHPMEMDSVLTQVVDGKWDRAAYLAEFQEKEKLEELFGKIGSSMRRGKPQQAIELIDEALATSKNEEIITQLRLAKLQVLLQDKDSADKLPAVLTETYASYEGRPEVINMVTWTIYELADAGELKDKKLIKQARQAAQKAAEKASADMKAGILDTVSHLQFVEGDTAGAIKTQELAISLVKDESKEEYQVFLDELKAALKEKR
ncbi:Thiol-disulfide oxidoreductase ResA [Pirellula sp. SH-Sr6A]|uniref:redoxin domain-containing protein n=1 Tax=Pirellula sp. SH-Sr6A TaxID=1632865 RepID=UPI00078D76A9|nr:redoxin domain-containing protein [Pirellula sp. SH-Sr6A]AMV32912.1 Thiol-disulfide oxidoreductase ResA [Pirellula sp. SH-Sr6A]